MHDFGNDWKHKIKVEKVLPPDVCPVPMYLGGANAWPPEDRGGLYGYADFLKATISSTHSEDDDLLEWCGGAFDPKVLGARTIELRPLRIKL